MSLKLVLVALFILQVAKITSTYSNDREFKKLKTFNTTDDSSASKTEKEVKKIKEEQENQDYEKNLSTYTNKNKGITDDKTKIDNLLRLLRNCRNENKRQVIFNLSKRNSSSEYINKNEEDTEYIKSGNSNSGTNSISDKQPTTELKTNASLKEKEKSEGILKNERKGAEKTEVTDEINSSANSTNEKELETDGEKSNRSINSGKNPENETSEIEYGKNSATNPQELEQNAKTSTAGGKNVEELLKTNNESSNEISSTSSYIGWGSSIRSAANSTKKNVEVETITETASEGSLRPEQNEQNFGSPAENSIAEEGTKIVSSLGEPKTELPTENLLKYLETDKIEKDSKLEDLSKQGNILKNSQEPQIHTKETSEVYEKVLESSTINYKNNDAISFQDDSTTLKVRPELLEENYSDPPVKKVFKVNQDQNDHVKFLASDGKKDQKTMKDEKKPFYSEEIVLDKPLLNNKDSLNNNYKQPNGYGSDGYYNYYKSHRENNYPDVLPPEEGSISVQGSDEFSDYSGPDLVSKRESEYDLINEEPDDNSYWQTEKERHLNMQKEKTIPRRVLSIGLLWRKKYHTSPIRTIYEKVKKVIREFMRLPPVGKHLVEKQIHSGPYRPKIEEVKSEGEEEEEYEDGQEEYEEGREEYGDGREEYEDGREEYGDGREEYEDGREEFEDGEEKYDDVQEEETEAGKEEPEAGKEELEAGKQEPEAGKEGLEAGKEEPEAGKEGLEAGKEKPEAGKEEKSEKSEEELQKPVEESEILENEAEAEEKKPKKIGKEPYFGKYKPAFEKYTPLFGKYKPLFGKYKPLFGKFIPDSGKYKPNSGKYKPDSEKYKPDSGKYKPNYWKHKPNSGKYKPDSEKYKPNSEKYKSDSGKYKPNSGKYKPNSGKYKPDSEKYKPGSGKYKPNSGKHKPNSGKYKPDPGKYKPNSGKYKPNSGKSKTYSKGKKSVNKKNKFDSNNYKPYPVDFLSDSSQNLQSNLRKNNYITHGKEIHSRVMSTSRSETKRAVDSYDYRETPDYDYDKNYDAEPENDNEMYEEETYESKFKPTWSSTDQEEPEPSKAFCKIIPIKMVTSEKRKLQDDNLIITMRPIDNYRMLVCYSKGKPQQRQDIGNVDVKNNNKKKYSTLNPEDDIPQSYGSKRKRSIPVTSQNDKPTYGDKDGNNGPSKIKFKTVKFGEFEKEPIENLEVGTEVEIEEESPKSPKLHCKVVSNSKVPSNSTKASSSSYTIAVNRIDQHKSLVCYSSTSEEYTPNGDVYLSRTASGKSVITNENPTKYLKSYTPHKEDLEMGTSSKTELSSDSERHRSMSTSDVTSQSGSSSSKSETRFAGHYGEKIESRGEAAGSMDWDSDKKPVIITNQGQKEVVHVRNPDKHLYSPVEREKHENVQSYSQYNKKSYFDVHL